MKIRNGFVSNSSSSSFVVGIKNPNKMSTNVKIEMEVNLADYGVVIDNVEELVKYYTDELCIDASDLNGDKNYIEAKKFIEKGGAVIIGSFSDEGTEAVGKMLCNTGLKDIIKDSNIKVIQSEAGY